MGIRQTLTGLTVAASLFASPVKAEDNAEPAVQENIAQTQQKLTELKKAFPAGWSIAGTRIDAFIEGIRTGITLDKARIIKADILKMVAQAPDLADEAAGVNAAIDDVLAPKTASTQITATPPVDSVDSKAEPKKEAVAETKPKPAVGSKEEKEAKKMEGLKIALAEAASKLGSDASKWQPGTQGKGSTKSRNDKGGVLLKFDKGKLSEDESLTAEGFACLKGAKLAPGNYKVTFSGAPNGPICMWMFNGAGNILEDGTPANTAGRIMKQGPEFNITVPSGCIGVDFGYITSALNPEVRFDSMKVTPLDIQYPELAKK